MPPSGSREKERPSSPSRQETCANNLLSSSLRKSSSVSSPHQRNRESTRQRRREANASNVRGGFGSRTSSTPDTSPRFVNTHKTRPNRRGDRASKEASSPTSISHSPIYFDVLLEEGEASPEKRAPQEPGLEYTELQRAIALSLDPKGKAPMQLRELEAEEEEKAIQLALHRSRKDAQRRSQGGKELQIGPEKEAAA